MFHGMGSVVEFKSFGISYALGIFKGNFYDKRTSYQGDYFFGRKAVTFERVLNTCCLLFSIQSG